MRKDPSREDNVDDDDDSDTSRSSHDNHNDSRSLSQSIYCMFCAEACAVWELMPHMRACSVLEHHKSNRTAMYEEAVDIMDELFQKQMSNVSVQTEEYRELYYAATSSMGAVSEDIEKMHQHMRAQLSLLKQRRSQSTLSPLTRERPLRMASVVVDDETRTEKKVKRQAAVLTTMELTLEKEALSRSKHNKETKISDSHLSHDDMDIETKFTRLKIKQDAALEAQHYHQRPFATEQCRYCHRVFAEVSTAMYTKQLNDDDDDDNSR